MNHRILVASLALLLACSFTSSAYAQTDKKDKKHHVKKIKKVKKPHHRHHGR